MTSNCKGLLISDFAELDPDIIKRVESSDFNTYCASNVEIRSFWGKKLTVDQILSYSKSINAPILNIAKDIHSLALKNFKSRLVAKLGITAIINEKVTKNASINIIKRMIKMAVKNSAEMRDEVFFQLVKQVRANNRQECCYLAWSLFCVISCFICPSESSIYYLLNYVKYVADNNRDDETRRSARFIFVRLLKNFLTKGRGVLPCSSEIELIKKKKKLSCRINLMTGGYLTVYFENYTVISDILKQICELMDIDKENYSKFGLFEITTKSGGLIEETWVEDFIKLADVIASWEHERLFYQRKLGINLEAKFNLYFRIRFFFPLDRNVFRDLLLEYNEVGLCSPASAATCSSSATASCRLKNSSN
jgi:hypothetical protein